MSTRQTPRRSSRQSTPTRDGLSPPPPSGSARKGMSASASTPSLASLAVPTASIRKSTSTRALSPRLSSKDARPALPLHAKNQLMTREGKLHKVKTQTLYLGDGPTDQHTIVIARVKCPVPKDIPGHIIKRFDTNAVSASSLFRAAFPTATDAEEAKEMAWVKKGKYGDTEKAGIEWDEAKKLSGTWIPTDKAPLLAKEYQIERFALDLFEFVQPSVAAEPIKTAPETPGRARSPRAKRARTAVSPAPSSAKAPSSPGGPASIHQKLETTKVDVKIADAPAGLAISEEAIAAELAASKALVDQIKKDTGATGAVTVSIKRTLEKDDDDDDAPLPKKGTLADLPVEKPVDKRGFFGKMFKRAPRARAVPEPREVVAIPAAEVDAPEEVATMLVEQPEEPGRRWLAGFGLAVAVGATAAAPYLFG